MKQYIHSVSLVRDRCRGCTTCLKRCPTEAIRIRDGHAVIKNERCIDCGECIRLCPYKAKKALYDSFDDIKKYKWTVAIPAPALYGQFDNLDDLDYVLTGLLDIGFNDVYEVACAAELVSEYTRQYIKQPGLTKPIISSACPVIVRLITERFPSLYQNVLPVLQPAELAAAMARKAALKAHPELESKDVGIFFISPCPAKVSYVKNPFGIERSDIDAVLSMSDVYFRLVSAMNKIDTPKSLSQTGLIGISWAGTGGEASALFNDKYLAADGIENVIKVLDEIDNGKLSEVDFVELNACNGGCVGGALTVENPYIAKARLQNLRRYLPVSQNHLFKEDESLNDLAESYQWKIPLEYTPVVQLSQNRAEAMRKMQAMQELHSQLPKIDCGSCGSPTCMTLAEDIVNGHAEIDDCVIKMKEHIKVAIDTLKKMEEEREREANNDGK